MYPGEIVWRKSNVWLLRLSKRARNKILAGINRGTFRAQGRPEKWKEKREWKTTKLPSADVGAWRHYSLAPHLQGCTSQESVWKPSQTGNWKEENLATVRVWLFTVVLPKWATGPLWTFPQLWCVQNNTFVKGDKRIKCKPSELWLQLQVTRGKKTEMVMLGLHPHNKKSKCWSLSHVWLFLSSQTVACQAPLSMGFSRWEYWGGWPFPPPGIAQIQM